jgi:hypothetical protein
VHTEMQSVTLRRNITPPPEWLRSPPHRPGPSALRSTHRLESTPCRSSECETCELVMRHCRLRHWNYSEAAGHQAGTWAKHRKVPRVANYVFSSVTAMSHTGSKSNHSRCTSVHDNRAVRRTTEATAICSPDCRPPGSRDLFLARVYFQRSKLK